MHNIEIPAAQLARVAHFRDQRHMFTSLDPRRTAHVVVDLQNGFMEPGAPVEVATAREIVPNVNRHQRRAARGRRHRRLPALQDRCRGAGELDRVLRLHVQSRPTR